MKVSDFSVAHTYMYASEQLGGGRPDQPSSLMLPVLHQRRADQILLLHYLCSNCSRLCSSCAETTEPAPCPPCVRAAQTRWSPEHPFRESVLSKFPQYGLGLGPRGFLPFDAVNSSPKIAKVVIRLGFTFMHFTSRTTDYSFQSTFLRVAPLSFSFLCTIEATTKPGFKFSGSRA
jgi:hypothetical protein